MREILFRAKRTDNGEWVEGFYSQFPKASLAATIIANGDLCAEDVADYIIVNKSKQHGNFSNSFPLEIVECEQYEVSHESICQYTGLKDKSDKKIFENDILNVTYSDQRGECRHAENYLLGDLRNTSVIGWLDYANELEIVGNIFDNPELIEH